jgi:hypothetical protein
LTVPGRIRQRTLTLLTALVGFALFTYAVRRAGLAEITDGVGRVGWSLLTVLALAGARFLLRTECWRQLVAGSARLSFGQALAAFLAGDAVGSVTPLGLLASEPTKVFLTRHHLATREATASLALENVVYSASVLAMVAFGSGLLLATATLPRPLREGAVAAVVMAVAAVAALWMMLRARVPFIERRISEGRFAPLGAVLDQVRRFAHEQPGRLAWVFVLDLLYHALAVVEVFVTLGAVMGSGSPSWTTAVIFETLNRVVTVVFKFVPFRVGVDEALSGALAPLLAVDPAAGVALAIVRKVRNLVWAGIGLGLIALHPAGKAQGA